jgi:Domain of unknown function (DUF1707)
VSEHPVDARSLRVSDAEREHVVELLRRATGNGSIDLDEFTERVDTALAARTRAELNVVLLDLPGLTHPDSTQVASPVRRTRQAIAPVHDTAGSEIHCVLSSVTRRGEWEVPERLDVQIAMGSAKLDFTETGIGHDVVQIDLDVVAGSVELRVPAGAGVEHHAVRLGLAGVDDKRRGDDKKRGRAQDTAPTFVLTGAVRAGTVEIRSPRRGWSKRR